MTQPKTDERVALNKLQRSQSFGRGILLAKTKNTGRSAVLLATSLAFGLAFPGEARAETDKQRVIEGALKNQPHPYHFPADVYAPNTRTVDGTRMRLGKHAEVPGTDFTKNPPQPLQMGKPADGKAGDPKAGDAKVEAKPIDINRTLQIVNASGKLNPEYLTYLRHFEEKPFSEIKDLTKTLRFVLIETGRKPILISVNFQSKKGTTELTAKQLGKKDSRLERDVTTELTPEQSDSLVDKIEYPQLWQEVPYTKEGGQYSYWILEYWDGKKYETATQFLPKDGYIKELGDELIGLTDLRSTDSTKDSTTADSTTTDSTKPNSAKSN